MRNILLAITGLLLNLSLIAQDRISPSSILEANFLIEVEPSFGFQTSYQRSISKPRKFYAFYAGLSELYLRTDETYKEEGTTGHTNANVFAGIITGELQFLKKKNLFFNTSIYLGWGYRQTKVRLQYPAYNIDRRYNESYHLLATGIDARIGYRFKNKWGVQAFAREDFSRMVDKYRAILGEKPGFIYGFGGYIYW
ncbi:MAG: hypothetical protein RIC35_17830 [Marinoscillum sp.]